MSPKSALACRPTISSTGAWSMIDRVQALNRALLVSWTPLCGVNMTTSLKSLFISTILRSVDSSSPSSPPAPAPARVRGGIVGRRGAAVLAAAPRAVRAGAGGAWTGARRGAGLCGGARSGSRGYPPLASGGSAAGGALCAQARSGVAAHS